MRGLIFGFALALVVAVASATADVKISGGTNSPQYTCNKDVGEAGTCTCTGGLDCIMIRDASVESDLD